MKIALLSFEFPPDTGFGGIGTYTWYHARALAKLGHEVHVLAGATHPTSLQTQTYDGFILHRFRAAGTVMRIAGYMGKHRLWWTRNRLENGWSMLRGLRELHEKHDFDVVEMPECGAEGLLVNYAAGLPTVVKFHSPAQLIMGCYDVRRVDHVLCSLVESIALRGASAFSSASEFLAREVRRKLGVRRPIRVVPNGIDVGLFDASEQVHAREKFGIPRTRLMIFFSGRMERRKGIHVCKEITAKILERHDVAFVFAGQDLFRYMRDDLLPFLSARKLRGSVHYLGKLDLTDVRSCLRQTDIFLLPSLWENCPYSCLEAMAAGRAIVSSDAGGLPELLRDGEEGLLAPAGDGDAFVAAIERLIYDGELRQRLGSAARQRVASRYTDVRVAKDSVALYGKLLTER